MDNYSKSIRKEAQIPSFEQAVEIFKTYFFNREDRVLYHDGNTHCQKLINDLELLDLLKKHLYGSSVVGAYTPGPDNHTQWLCMDVDGAGHSEGHSLSNPLDVVQKIQNTCSLFSIPCHIEKSKGAQGYHVWIFFKEPIPASEARSLGILLAPQDALLVNGTKADAARNKGIEVFPKQVELESDGTGNGVWLPWTNQAKPGGALFYRFNEDGDLLLIEEPLYEFAACDRKKVRDLLLDFSGDDRVNPPSPAEAISLGKDENPLTYNDLTGENELYSPYERIQISNFLQPLDLKRVYGEYLTGNKSGTGWWECQDPFKDGLDHTPSAAVADGTGNELKGFFYSHRPEGKRLHIWNAMVELKFAQHKQDALEQISRWTQKSIPECLSPEVDNQKTLRQKIEEYNREFAGVMYGSKFQVLQEHMNHKNQSTQSFLDIKDFKCLKMNDIITFTEKEIEETISLPDYWLKSKKRREYKGVIFDPNSHNPEYYNLWKGFSFHPDSTKKCDLLLEHIWDNVCQEQQAEYDYLLTWLAHGIQRPGDRPQTAVVIRGKKGTGKGTLIHTYGSFFGPHFCYTNDMNQVLGRFNALTLNSLVINADEAYWPGLKDMEGRLKGLITDPVRVIEQKGKDSIQIDNFIRLIITANEDWIVPCSADERRFFVLEMGQKHVQDLPYFEKLNAELEAGGRNAFLHYLLQYDIAKVNLRDIPQTEALLKQKELSGNPVQKFWKEILMEGQLLPDHEGWSHAVPKDDLYHYFVEKVRSSGFEKSNWQSQFSAKLNEICPGIETRRITCKKFDHQMGCHVEKRAWCYVFPSLADCRFEYEKIMRHTIHWPSLIEDGSLLTSPLSDEFEREFIEL